MLAQLHLVLAVLVAVGGGTVAIVVILGAATHHPVRFALDRVILGVLLLLAIAVLSGLVILVTGARPHDPLHLLYAVLALLVLPVARFWDRLSDRRALAVVVGSVVIIALVLRLFQTG